MNSPLIVFVFSSNDFGGTEIAMRRLFPFLDQEYAIYLPKEESKLSNDLKSENHPVHTYSDLFKIKRSRKAIFLSFGTRAMIISSIVVKMRKSYKHIHNVRGADLNRKPHKSLIYRLLKTEVDYWVSNSSTSLTVWEGRREIDPNKAVVIRNILRERGRESKEDKIHHTLTILSNVRKGKGFEHLEPIIKGSEFDFNLEIRIFGQIRDVELDFDKLSGLKPNVRVIYKGFTEDLDQVFLTTDALLLMSESEGLPNSFLESLLYGTPVISSDVGGVSELIRDGYNGLLFDSGDINGCIEKIDLFYSDDELRGVLMSNTGELPVGFDNDEILASWNKVFNSVLGHN